jgi:hypothetical protein
MKEFFDKAMAWIKGNTILAVIGAAVITFLFFPKILKLGSAPRRRRRILATRGRSYGTRRRIRGAPRRSYSRGGKAKKPWQIKGSLAARRHMALIRRRRRA